jgi:hypothetical protein
MTVEAEHDNLILNVCKSICFFNDRLIDVFLGLEVPEILFFIKKGSLQNIKPYQFLKLIRFYVKAFNP